MKEDQDELTYFYIQLKHCKYYRHKQIEISNICKKALNEWIM